MRWSVKVVITAVAFAADGYTLTAFVTVDEARSKLADSRAPVLPVGLAERDERLAGRDLRRGGVERGVGRLGALALRPAGREVGRDEHTRACRAACRMRTLRPRPTRR